MTTRPHLAAPRTTTRNSQRRPRIPKSKCRIIHDFDPMPAYNKLLGYIFWGLAILLVPSSSKGFNAKNAHATRRRRQDLPILVINLEKDRGRWSTVTQNLISNGASQTQIHRMPAVYGKDLSPDELKANTTWTARHFLTRGTIGCFLSHRKCWEQVLEGSHDYQLILEDDVMISDPSFLNRVHQYIDELQETNDGSEAPSKNDQWHVLFLGALGCVHPKGKYGLNRIAGFMSGGLRRPRQATTHCHVPRRALGAHAYLLTREGAKILLNKTWLASGHVDVVAWGEPDLNLFCVHPMVAFQDMTSQSTIGAVTQGIETLLPKHVLDAYTGITFEWIFNAPVIRLGHFLLTMGRSIIYVFGGFVASFLLWDKAPWLLALHTSLFACLFAITKITTMRFGRRT